MINETPVFLIVIKSPPFKILLNPDLMKFENNFSVLNLQIKILKL